MSIKRSRKRILFVLCLLVVLLLTSLQLTEVLSQTKHNQRRNAGLPVSDKGYNNPFHIHSKPKLKWRLDEGFLKLNQSDILIYNRLPKCASTITRLVIARLRDTFPNRFHLKLDSRPHIKQVLNEIEQEQLVTALSALPKSTVYIRHVRFLDFSKFHRKRPSYINIIRDPVEQFISAYYFNRFGFVGWKEEKVKKWLSHKSDEERFMSLEQCIMENVTRCVERNTARYFSYFCGHEDECNDFDEWSMEKAKENVEKQYTVVGIAEKYEDTLWLFEKSLPRYFADISSLYQHVKDNLPATKTAKKVNPSPAAKQKLREALRLRVEFYEFVNQRFNRQLAYYKAKT